MGKVRVLQSGVLVLLMSALLGGPLMAQGTENLLANPGFEAGEGQPAGWLVTGKDFVSWREDGGHGDRRYVRLADPDAHTGLKVESAPLPCRPGGDYRASAWFRTAGRCSPGVYLNFHDDMGNRVHHVFNRVAGPTQGWVQGVAETTAPTSASTVSVLLYAYIGDTGTFDVDDVALSVAGGAEPGSGGICPVTAGNREAVTLDSRLELFVDGTMVDGLSGSAVRRMHHPQRRQVVLQLDRPWEGETSAYFAVMPVESGVRIYYRGSRNAGGPEVTCVAESPDGIAFTRPSLGLWEWEGSKDNNIVWMGAGTHNFTPFLDTNPEAPADQRFKALASAGPKAQLVAFVSADGYSWRKLREEPVITKGAFDSQNLAFWDPVRKLYVEYHRGFQNGFRDIMTSTSHDFINWTEPQWLDYGSPLDEHLYTNAITPYFRAPHIYLGFPNRYVPGRKKVQAHKDDGVDDALLMSSRDMLRFERWREAFVRPTLDEENWTDRNNYVAWGIVPLNEREIGIYSTDHYRHKSARLVLNTIRTDGFASIYADMTGGQMLTRPFTFTGKRLEVNYASSAAGSLKFALCDEAGESLESFGLAESEVLFGNELAHTVSWGGRSELSGLAGKTVRLRVNLKDADLFSFRFID